VTAVAAASRTRPSLAGAFELVREYAIVVCVLALFLTLTFTSDVFLTETNMKNVLESVSTFGIIACALTLLLIAGEFDLSVGAIFVITGIIAAKLQPELGTAPALLLGIAAATGLGLFNGIAVAYFRINSFIATLATSLMIVGLGTQITEGFQLYIADPGFAVLGNDELFGVKYSIWLLFLFALVCAFILARTKLGRWLYATGGNAEAARLSGIDTRLVKVGAFVFSGFAAGVAGAILISRTATAIAGNGIDVVFLAFAAVVVGGTSVLGGRGAVWRTVLGLLFLEFIRNGFNLLEVNPYYQDIIRGGIILLAVGIDAVSRRA
jgi:ribose transport system permease protein